MSTKSTLLMIYNASGTLTGHLAYGYHHLLGTEGKDCSACALTHGPKLALNEREEWSELKGRIERGQLQGAEGKEVSVRTLHKEDVTPEVSDDWPYTSYVSDFFFRFDNIWKPKICLHLVSCCPLPIVILHDWVRFSTKASWTRLREVFRNLRKHWHRN